MGRWMALNDVNSGNVSQSSPPPPFDSGLEYSLECIVLARVQLTGISIEPMIKAARVQLDEMNPQMYAPAMTPLYQQHASHTLASRAYGPQPHTRSSSAPGPYMYTAAIPRST